MIEELPSDVCSDKHCDNNPIVRVVPQPGSSVESNPISYRCRAHLSLYRKMAGYELEDLEDLEAVA